MTDPGVAYLLARVGLVEQRIRAVIEHRRRGDPAPDDPFRGLYLSDDMVERLLAEPEELPAPDHARRGAIERVADEAEAAGWPVRLRDLCRDAGLNDLDVEVLLIALVPDLDSRFERLYGYLNDDVTRRRATVGLALELAGVTTASGGARDRFGASAPLVEFGLVFVEDRDRPFLTRALRVPDRVTAHLLGSDVPDPELSAVLAPTTCYDAEPAASIAAALAAGVGLVHVREQQVAGTGVAVSAAALTQVGRAAVCLDLARLAAESDPDAVVIVAGREALLTGAGIVGGPVEALAESAPGALRRLTELTVPVLLTGRNSWDPVWTDGVPLLAAAPMPGPRERRQMWLRELGCEMDGADAARDLDAQVAAVTEQFVLGPSQVSRAVRAARASALLTGVAPSAEQLRRGARAQNAAGLERLSRRVEPEVSWRDLVLPDQVLAALRDLAARARHRDLVLNEWRMRPGGGRGHGVTALFAGDSGTGKTMSAEVIATELGLDLYTINLATVVDKYIGETEKNLERIFSEASGVNAVLLFDEADAIFGKRSEVRDAHDRYANIESAYLLQRMETFDGLAVLATNLRSNIDDAFTRRLDTVIDFPAPNEALRRALWGRCLAPPLPCAADVDLDFCARSFALSGGNIRSIAITAGYYAADAGRPITMADLVAAIQQEYRKLGRLVLEQEFGDYMELARSSGWH